MNVGEEKTTESTTDGFLVWCQGWFCRRHGGRKGGPLTCLRNTFLDVVNPLESKIHKNVCTGSWFSPESQVTTCPAFLSFLPIGEPFWTSYRSCWNDFRRCLFLSSHKTHGEFIYTVGASLCWVQASAEFNIPSSNVSKTSKNTHFLNPLRFASTTSSSFQHSSVVIIFHLETKLLSPHKKCLTPST